MSFKSQTRKGTSRQRAKSTREKKPKEKKKRVTVKKTQGKTKELSATEVTEQTINSISKLGNQVFALSPFSQYFDDWLLNLRNELTEFESNPAIKVDEQFMRERAQIFLDVEAALAEKRLVEATLTKEAKALEENNHKIADANKEYSEKSRELSNKRNVEIQKLSNEVHQLEDDLASQQNIKLGFFKFKEKRLATQKLAQTNQDLKTAKNKLEVTIESFKAEQDKLHDNYERQKQELFAISDSLHKQLEKLETDASTQARQLACNDLVQAINALMQRASTPEQSA
jgi:chromosome segregation ATPase